MTFDTVVAAMLQALPELKPSMDEDFAGYGEMPPEPYTAFADVLVPAAYAALDSGDEALAKRFFAFFEQVASDPNEAVNALSHIQLIEILANEPVRLNLAWPYMGKNTREQARVYARETKRQFGKEIRLPE